MTAPALEQVYFYLTKGCNLRCRHCWIAPGYQAGGRNYPALELESFRSVIEQAMPLGLKGVKLTGGEPLLNPHIGDILDYVRSQGLRLVVETNGVLCTPTLAGLIATCKDPFVSVSLDGADAETHEWVRGVEGCFDAALIGIKNLVAAGLRPQVIMTIMRRNRAQIEAVVRLAESLGAGSVKFNILQPTARGESLHERGEALTIDELIKLGRWVEGALASTTGMMLFFDYPAAFRPLGKMFADGTCGCGTCGISGVIGVLADGSYALCGIGETVPDLVFGDVLKDRLDDVWDGNPVLREIRDGLPRRLEGICGECIMKAVCLGGCLAENYHASGSLWAPFWFCEAARARGFFPESRLTPKIHNICKK